MLKIAHKEEDAVEVLANRLIEKWEQKDEEEAEKFIASLTESDKYKIGIIISKQQNHEHNNNSRSEC